MKELLLEALPGFNPEIGLLVAVLHDSTREWRRHLGPAGAEDMVWQPFAGGYSLGAVLLHMIDTEAYWLETVAARKRRPAGELKLFMTEGRRVASCKWPEPYHEPLEWYLELQDRIRQRALSAIRDLDPDKAIDRRDWGVRMTVRWILGHVVEHDSYHGGQLVLLKTLRERIK